MHFCETCGLFRVDTKDSTESNCACTVTTHKANCAFRRYVSCPVNIECEHGVDYCPTCDACDCSLITDRRGAVLATKEKGEKCNSSM